MLFKRFKIYKNELCPCGSTIKYKKCCFIKKDEKIDTSHIQKVFLDVGKSFDLCKYKVCLHPKQEDCKPPIKHAHSIQNHGVLSQISVNNHVRAFRTDKTQIMDAKLIDSKTVQGKYTMESVGVNKATTQTCFCNFHDSTLFAPIESNPNGFQKTDLEQLFIYAYKAFAFEYYKSKVALIALQNFFKRIPQRLRKYPFLFVPNYRQAQLKDREMEFYKDFFDNALINKEYTRIETKIIEIPFKIAFTTTECITPMFDLQGKRIHNITNGLLRRMFITIFPNHNCSYILLSYLDLDKGVFEKYVEQLSSLDKTVLYEYLSTFLPLYSENLVISPKLWDRWKTEGQEAFNSLINIFNNDIIKLEFKLTTNISIFLKANKILPKCSCNLFEKVL